MKILMLGWEFPPVYSGGLGVVSRNLAQELAAKDIEIHFALPHYIRKNIPESEIPEELSLVDFDKINKKLKKIAFYHIPSGLSSPYLNEESYETQKNFWESSKNNSSRSSADNIKHVYGQNLFQEIERYAHQMEVFAEGKDFDIIHAHDWITFEAGIRLRKKLNIPLVLHVHATELDRTGNNPNQEIFKREKKGMGMADRIISVSHYTKKILVEEYGIPTDKIKTIHNANTLKKVHHRKNLPEYLKKKEKDEKIVLFIGRVTIQKGPDYFLRIAERVLEKTKKVKFLMVGTGDMFSRIIKEIAAKRLQKNIFCLGFVDGKEKEKIYQNADLAIMPSISEPFGLTALEAAENGIPLILSYNYGATEVLFNSLKSDFWDVDRMADYVLAVLKYPVLQKVLSTRSIEDMQNLDWETQAEKVQEVYTELLNNN